MTKCILSGLDIPDGKYSVDHFVAKFWLPRFLYNLPENKKPAIRIMNNIKGVKFPCEWYDTRYELCYIALQKWNLKSSDKNIIIEALDRFATEKDTLNPCQHCVLSSKAREYCYAQRNLEKYRIRWLYGIESRKGKNR